MTYDEPLSEETRHVVYAKEAHITQRILIIARMLGFAVELAGAQRTVIVVTPTPLSQTELAALLWLLFHPASKEFPRIVARHPTLEHIVRWHATWQCGRSLSTQLDPHRLPISRLTWERFTKFLEAETEERAEWILRHYQRDLLREVVGTVWQQLDATNDAARAHLQARATRWFASMVDRVSGHSRRHQPAVIMHTADWTAGALPAQMRTDSRESS